MPCDGLSSLLSFGRLEVRVRMWKRNVRMHVRCYTKGETISDGRQWRFKWRPQWYQLHAGIEFNWIEGTARGPLSLLRLMFCNHLDFGSFHVCRGRRSSWRRVMPDDTSQWGSLQTASQKNRKRRQTCLCICRVTGWQLSTFALRRRAPWYKQHRCEIWWNALGSGDKP